jgi:hypothetical protein
MAYYRGFMPVTAKLSKQFYDRLGDEIANELVDWFNKVDDTYRTELRDLNELNFARFDAKLEQRATGVEAKLEQRIIALEVKLEQRIAALEVKLDQRIAALEVKLGQRIADLEVTLGRRVSGVEAALRAEMVTMEKSLSGEISKTRVELYAVIADTRSDLMRWMFGLWATQMVALTGVILAIVLRGL